MTIPAFWTRSKRWGENDHPDPVEVEVIGSAGGQEVLVYRKDQGVFLVVPVNTLSTSWEGGDGHQEK